MNDPFSTGRVSRAARNTESNQTNSSDETDTSQTPALETQQRASAAQQAFQQEEEARRERVGANRQEELDVTNLDEDIRREGVQRAARIIKEAFEASEDDIRTASYLFDYYNTRASILTFEENENLEVLQNSLSLSKLREDIDQNITLMSHENYKIIAQPTGPIFGPKEMISNGPFISPDQLFLLKSNYLSNKLTSIKNRFFSRNKNAKNNQKTYLNSIKNNNTFKKDYLKKIELFLDNNKSELKKISFGNQLIDYVDKESYSNYFGKVSNIIYKTSKEIHSTNLTTTHSNEDFFRLNGITKNENSSSKRYTNLQDVLTNYFKLKVSEDGVSTSLLSFNEDSLIDSNIVATSALLNCALGLRNIHEGSFTNPNYIKENDLNNNIYSFLSNNNTLKKMPILTHVYNYDVFINSDENKINFTSPAYTNDKFIGSFETERFTFKDDSIYNLVEIYDNNKIHKDHFTNINLIQRSNNKTNTDFYSFYPDGNNPDGFGISTRIRENHNWIDFDNYSNNDFITHDEFEEIFDITVDEYLAQRNNLLDVDAIICSRTFINNQGLQLIYVDNESQIRVSDHTDIARFKYLSSPTFNLFSIHRDSSTFLDQDLSFYEAFNENHNPPHETRSSGNYNSHIFFTRTKSLKDRSTEDHSRKIPIDFLRIKNKKFSDLNPNRILFAYANHPPSSLQSDNVFRGNFNSLSYFINRVWSIKTEGNIEIDPEYNTISGGNTNLLRSIDFRKARMGAGERFINSSGEELNAITERGKIPDIKDVKYHPFVLVKNTNKTYDYNSSILKFKFLKDSGNEITSEEESFYNRVEMSSSSRLSYKSDNKKNVFKKFNTTSCWGKDKNIWINKAFKLKRDFFKFKARKLEENQFFSFLENVSNKSKNIVKNTKLNAYSFLHSNEDVLKLFNMEESPYLYQKNNTFIDMNNYKVNFNKKIMNIHNSLNLLDNSEIESFSTFTSQESFKNFLEVYYPESFLKNSSSLMYKFLYDINKILNKYNKNYISANKELVGFEKLLADILASDDEAYKYFIYSVIQNKIKNSGHKDQANNSQSFFNNINSNSNGLYNSYLTSIFSYENISNQNTFTLRTIDSQFLQEVDLRRIRGDSFQDGVSQDHRVGFVELSGGKITNLLFPHNKHITNLEPGHLNIFTIDPANELRISGHKKNLGLFFTLNTYNYDVYLHTGDSENISSNSFFSSNNILGSNLNINIDYVVLSSDPKEGYTESLFEDDHQKLDKNNPDRVIKDFVINAYSGAIDEDATPEEVYDRISDNLFYKIFNSATYTKDHTYDLMFEDNTFTNKLSDIILSFITYYFDKVTLENESAINIINSNEQAIKDLIDITRLFVGMYKFEYERIQTLSLHRSLELEVQVQNDNEDNLSIDNFWDDFIKNKVEASYALTLSKINSNDTDYDINSNTLNHFLNQREVINQYHRSKQSTDNFNIINLLNKSDYLETINFDLIFAYLSNFEDNKNKLLSQNQEKLNLVQEISGLSEEINDIENISFDSITSNKFKICKISKLMQNDNFYSIKKEDDINSGNLNIGDIDFDSLNIFNSNIKQEEDKATLAKIGLDIFLLEDGLQENFNKIDILRFGIPYELANGLSNDKIMSIMIYPVNHKYPEIEFEPFEFLYTPILTDIAPYLNNTNNNLEGFLGVYDVFHQNFSSKYKILHEEDLINLISTILANISNKREILGFSNSLTPNGLVGLGNINRIIIARKLSNSIKYLNESYNSVFDDSKINKLNIDFDNILSNKTKIEFDSIDLNEYKKIFNENKETVESYLVEEGGYTNIENRKDQVSKNIHSIEFFKKIDKDMSNIDFLKSLTTDTFFDIFSVRISKESLREKIVSDLPESALRHILQDKDDFSNSYSYTIQTKIY